MDQVKKRKLKQVLGWVAMVTVIGLLAAMPLLAQSEAEAAGPAVSILSDTVKTGTIETVLRGGGTLTEQEAVEVTVFSGIKLKRYLVRNGDAVVSGDPVAEVDPVSVMNAIIQVQEHLDALKQDMADSADEETTAELKTAAGGRVKAVYAKEGDRVRDVMLEHGALAVLSLSGRMAVKVTCDIRLSVGETVTVTFANGTDTKGRVESCLDGTAVISVEDEAYAIGETVTVLTGDVVLGSGDLYVYNAWNAIAWSGTVEEVRISPEETVDAGDVLMDLTDEESAGTIETLAEEHREYESILQSLLLLQESGVITANCDGVIAGVDEESTMLLENDTDLTDFSLENIRIMEVIPQDTMTLTITLDERDVGKVVLGQTAWVKVDALKGQVFEAVVTAVGTHGTNNGGSSKFTVALTLPRGENMLVGMRGSAGITLETTENVLTVPVAALVDQGSKTLVYTGYDSETGELINPVTVTTGVSDGITVEILSGLEAGDTVCYSYYEALAAE